MTHETLEHLGGSFPAWRQPKPLRGDRTASFTVALFASRTMRQDIPDSVNRSPPRFGRG